MLDAVIRAALRYRVLTSVSALAILFYGGLAWRNLPINIFPDLDRPRVTILTEASGLAPEEGEVLVTVPVEAVLTGGRGGPGVGRPERLSAAAW